MWDHLSAALPPSLANAAPARTRARYRADSASLHAQLVLSISEFQMAWRQEWQSVEMARIDRQGSGLGDLQRWTLVHCHPDGEVDGALPQEKDRS